MRLFPLMSLPLLCACAVPQSAEPSLAPAQRGRIADFYRDDVRELAHLLERDLDVWRL